MRTNYLMRALLALVALVAAFVEPATAMGSLLAYTVTANADVDKIWRKAQGKLQPGFNFVTEEFKWAKEFKELEIDASLRSMEFPVDLYEDRGITSLPEGGREAEPMSRNAEDALVSFIHVNGRFTVAKIAKWAGQADGGAGEIENQLTFQGLKKMQAIGRELSDQFWGYSTNYKAQTSTNATQSSGTYTLLNAYGDSAISGSTTAQKNYIANLFKVGDRVALIRTAALVSNAIGEVTAVTAGTPSIDVTWAGSVDSDANDYVVLANGASATTIAHTSYSRGLVGLLDMTNSTSVHGISSSSVANWSVAYSDTAAGRFTGQKWRRGLDEMQNYGNAQANPVTLMSQGVKRDVIAQYSAGLRYDDAFALEIDGEPKGKGREFRSSRRVPPGMVFLFDQNKAVRRKSIHDTTQGTLGWSQAKELIDDSGYVFAVDWSGFICTTNRKLFSYFEAQTEL